MARAALPNRIVSLSRLYRPKYLGNVDQTSIFSRSSSWNVAWNVSWSLWLSVSLKIHEVGMLPNMALYLSAVLWINLGQCLRWQWRQMWPTHIFLLCGCGTRVHTQNDHLKPSDLDTNLGKPKCLDPTSL